MTRTLLATIPALLVTASVAGAGAASAEYDISEGLDFPEGPGFAFAMHYDVSEGLDYPRGTSTEVHYDISEGLSFPTKDDVAFDTAAR
ncbi:MAG: hypothetical protein AAF871_07900 [Pseudomonadota bacterium]